MEEEKHIERIEAYLAGKMSADEKHRFEGELDANHALNRLYKEHKYFLDGVAGLKGEAFTEKLRHLKSADQTTSLSWLYKNRAHIALAASVLLVLGILYFLVQPFGPHRLAKEFYTAPFAQIQRNNPPPEDSLYDKGMVAYGGKRWTEAITAFEKIEESHPMFQRSLYYKAHALAGKGDYESALLIFRNPLFTNGQYAQQAEWFAALMLIYLKHPIEEVTPSLQSIANNEDHFYREKAVELLERLDR